MAAKLSYTARRPRKLHCCLAFTLSPTNKQLSVTKGLHKPIWTNFGVCFLPQDTLTDLIIWAKADLKLVLMSSKGKLMTLPIKSPLIILECFCFVLFFFLSTVKTMQSLLPHPDHTHRGPKLCSFYLEDVCMSVATLPRFIPHPISRTTVQCSRTVALKAQDVLLSHISAPPASP